MKPPVAKLAYLSQPAPGVVILNLQVEGVHYARIELTRDQLRDIVVEGAAFALREQA